MVKKTLIAIPIILVAVIIVCAMVYPPESPLLSVLPSDTSPPTTGTIVTPTVPESSTGPLLDVIFLDVGQADCILLQTDGHNMLIDAGNTGQDTLILNYLAEYSVTSLDYLVATHPHADHIGSMASVVNKMDNIDTVIMSESTHTTSTYTKLLNAINAKDISITVSIPGETFAFGDATITILAPNSYSGDINNDSVVLSVEYDEITFIFTGDADTASETEQVDLGFSLKADVLKAGHHGSRTASSQKYLNAINPDYVVITCGTGNSYGHPHKEAMTRLTNTDANIYRTDEHGTITFTTNGKTITITTTKEYTPTPTPTTAPDMIYVGNKNSKTLHLSTCKSLPSEANSVYFDSRQEAIDAEYKPCGSCKP